MVLVAFEVIGCIVLYSLKKEELSDMLTENRKVEGKIKISKDKVKDHAEIKKKLQVLRDREKAIAKLQSARTGPTAMLLEIARLMTRGRGPSIDPDELQKIRDENPLAMHNVNWDSRRLWLTSFVEDSRTVRLAGLARDGEDVSELARRMNLSSYFYDVRLLPGKRKAARAGGEEWVDFKLEARVKY
jgi:type IV pilus assembly protein PilN